MAELRREVTSGQLQLVTVVERLWRCLPVVNFAEFNKSYLSQAKYVRFSIRLSSSKYHQLKNDNLLMHIPLLVSYQKTVSITFPRPNLRGAGGNKRNSQRTLYHYILNQPTSFEASIEYCVLMSRRLRMCHGTRKNRNRRHLKSSDIGALRVTNHRLGLNPAQENSNSTGILL